MAKQRTAFVGGLYLAGGLVLCSAVVFFVRMGFAYTGSCGGYFPGVSSPRPCSFGEYVVGDVAVIGLLLVLTYWPLALTALVVPPSVGFWLDRRSAGSRV